MKKKEIIAQMLTDLKFYTTESIENIFRDKTTRDVLDLALEKTKKRYLLCTPFVERGVSKVSYKCTACGAEGEVTGSLSSPTKTISCHCCGNDKTINTKWNYSPIMLFEETTFFISKITDDYAVLSEINNLVHTDIEKDEKTNGFTFLYSKAKFDSYELKNMPFINEVKDNTIFVFFEEGFQNISKTGKTVSSPQGWEYMSIIRKLKNCNFVHDANYKQFVEKLQKKIAFDSSRDEKTSEAIIAYHEMVSVKTKATKKSSLSLIKKEDFKKEILACSFKKRDDDCKLAFLNALQEKKIGVPHVTITQGIENIEVVFPCPCCETMFIKKFSIDEVNKIKTKFNSAKGIFPVVKCPHCGKELSFDFYMLANSSYHYNRDTNFSVFFWEPYSGNKDFVVVRKFAVSFCLEDDKSSPFLYKEHWSIKEDQRVFLSAKELYVVDNLETTPEIVTARDISSIYNRNTICGNTKEEIKSIIEGSSLKYSGILDAWGLGSNPDLKIDEPGLFSASSYSYTVWKFPVVEPLLKAGFIDIVKDICRYNKTVQSLPNPKGKSIYDILKITKPVYRLIREKSLILNQIQMAQKLWEADNTMTEEEYNIICSNYIENAIIDLKIKYGIRFSRSLEYLDNCYNFQCIPMNEAAKLWADYLGMATTAGYNTKNRTIRFPFSLKREHDVVNFVTSTMSGKCDLEKFKKKAEENAKFNYSFKPLGLIVKGPNSPQEVIDEGMILHHCVSHYVNAIIEGKSIVMFIRKEDAPDEAYYTAELIDNGSEVILAQVKGDMNSDPSVKTAEGKAVIDFIKKWAAFKKLTIKLSFVE